MPVNLTWEKQEAIPEGLKEHAVEKDGKWVFEAETAAEVGNLKATLKKERDGRTKYESELKRFEKFKEVADAEEEERDAFFEAWKKRNEPPENGKGKPDPDAQKQFELREKLHAKEIKKRDEQIAALTTDRDMASKELREFKLWTPLRELFIKHEGNPEDWELARLDLGNKRRFDFDEDGKIVVMEDGAPSTVTPEKFFKDAYSDQRPKFYKASNAGGSGATNEKKGAGGGKTITRERFESLSQSERMKISKEGVQIVD